MNQQNYRNRLFNQQQNQENKGFIEKYVNRKFETTENSIFKEPKRIGYFSFIGRYYKRVQSLFTSTKSVDKVNKSTCKEKQFKQMFNDHGYLWEGVLK